jgi:hypothetical protein
MVNAKTPFFRHRTGKMALKVKPHPLLNPPLEREEAENMGVEILSFVRREA